MPERFCVVDGRFVNEDGVSLGAMDRSFMLGDGLFETVNIREGKPVWLDEHIARMEKSALFSGMSFDRNSFSGELCAELISKNRITGGFLRITLSRGKSQTGRFGDIPQRGVVVIIGANLKPDGISFKAAFAPWPVNENDPATAHKTTSRFSAVIAKREAKNRALDELVFANTKNELAEGILSNLFWVKGERLFTPSKECGLLPGITRTKVMEKARRLGIEVTEGRFERKELLEAGEIFFTNSLIGVRPCAEFEGRQLTAGKMAAMLGEDLF